MNVTAVLKTTLLTAAFIAFGAHADPITYTFTGAVDSGYGFDGQTVTGSLTVDPASFAGNTYTSGDPTYGYAYGYSNSAPVAGSITFSGGYSFDFAGAYGMGQSLMEVVKYPDLNEFVTYGQSYGYDANGNYQSRFLEVYTYDFLGAASGIFSAAHSDLSIDQAVAFNTPGSTTGGYFEAYDSNDGFYRSASFQLTSINVSNVPAVPEPETYALMIGGLGLLGAMRLRRQSRDAK